VLSCWIEQSNLSTFHTYYGFSKFDHGGSIYRHCVLQEVEALNSCSLKSLCWFFFYSAEPPQTTTERCAARQATYLVVPKKPVAQPTTESTAPPPPFSNEHHHSHIIGAPKARLRPLASDSPGGGGACFITRTAKVMVRPHCAPLPGDSTLLLHGRFCVWTRQLCGPL
jgi:hypothetical protein